MSFSAEQRNTLEKFTALTGLKEKWAKECFNLFGGYAPAMASFAQSFESLPDEYFDQREVATKNATVIDQQLVEIYKRAREIKKKNEKSDDEVWASYYTHNLVNQAPSTHVDHVAAPAPKISSVTAPVAAAPATFLGGFGSAAKQPVTPSTFSFGFGSATAPVAAAPATSAMNGFWQKVAKEVPASQQTEKKVQYCEPSHFTGPFFEMPLFWTEEVEKSCPLLNLNYGYLENNRDSLRSLMEPWVKKADFYKGRVQYVVIEDDDEETIRVIIKDADRTFFHPEHRTKFVAFLTAMYHEFGAYGQAMSYLAGLCLLVLNEEETASVLRFVSKVYIPGHWAAEAIGFATSAWVVEHFMQKLCPDVAKHLDKLNFWPDTYLQKILTGLCIHVLRFSELFTFLDLFMNGGIKFLIKFCIAIVNHFSDKILNLKSSAEANALYEIMRLDSKVADLQDIRSILSKAPSINLGEDENIIDLIRSMVYDKRVSPRLQRAPKTETFEPCEKCNTRKPVWWEEEIGAVCDECKNADPSLTYTKY